MAETHLIEVVAGRGQPPSLELRPGVELAPLSVGTGGAWQVTANGVRQVHLYVYFDGQTLFLQSAEADDPPKMNGRPVPSAWTSVAGRCVITFGQAQLVFRPADDAREEPAPASDGDATVASPIGSFPGMPANLPPARAPLATEPHAGPGRPFKPGQFAAPIDESTRLQPLEDFLGAGGGEDATGVEALMEGGGAPPAMNVRPAAGAPWGAPQPLPAAGRAPMPMPGPPMYPMQPGMPPMQGGPPAGGPPMYPMQPGMPMHGMAPQGMHPQGPPSGLLNIGPPSLKKPEAPETLGQKLSREWRAAPPLRKGLILAMPFALGLAFWLIFAGTGSPPTPGRKPVASAQPSASTSATPGSAPSSPMASSSVAPSTTTPTPQTATDTQPAVHGTVAVSPPVPPPPPPVQAGDAGAIDRRERQAADFVAQHAYDQAIRLYEQLAAERPQNPAFREAARILREKNETGRP